jgi:hypothetical protein
MEIVYGIDSSPSKARITRSRNIGHEAGNEAMNLCPHRSLISIGTTINSETDRLNRDAYSVMSNSRYDQREIE